MTNKYKLILTDPPWHFKLRSEKNITKSPQGQYACMSLEEIAKIPVADWAEKDCMLFMWATNPMLPQAITLMESWGFTYKTGGAWHKRTKKGKTQFGTGYILRSASEPFIIGTRGKPKVKSRSVRNLIDAAVREHSRKPDLQYSVCEALADGPYLEMFARQSYPGWDAWGNETEKFNVEKA